MNHFFLARDTTWINLSKSRYAEMRCSQKITHLSIATITFALFSTRKREEERKQQEKHTKKVENDRILSIISKEKERGSIFKSK